MTPPSGGDQYFDFRGTAGTLFQDVVIPTSGIVTIGAWFSARDTPRDVSGLTIRLRNSAGTVVATGSTSFSSTEPIGIWREVRIENTAVPAGTYTFEADLPNPANIDLASVDFTPTGIAILKSATGITDLDGNGPDQGDILNYDVSLRNTGSAALTNVQVSDIGATVNGGPIAVLNAGQTDTTTFTIAQTLTQNDFDVGQALNQAVASASQPGGSLITDQSDPLSFSGNADTLTALPTTRSMVMDKTADTIGPLSAGMTVNYSYKVTNNGNVTIRDVIVVDTHNGSGTLPVPDDEVLITDVLPSADSSDLDSTDQMWSVLAPGDTVEFTAPYTVMQSDIDNLQP